MVLMRYQVVFVILFALRARWNARMARNCEMHLKAAVKMVASLAARINGTNSISDHSSIKIESRSHSCSFQSSQPFSFFLYQ
ncbi:hypothetical protein BCR42DRAFT_419105 [Absidia repens]|uniref:Secreted protein n=1 Tax=Absidia repens TaxID=90262 RepID=A0A1X2IAV5_9FUNG|nr:hypothetical protein BCR42DRAFT_419105 [Absidia repens]